MNTHTVHPECDCEADLSTGTVCDVKSGQCKCAHGVTGIRCDQCVAGYLRIPTLGCRHCDECVHVLKDDIEAMFDEVHNVTGQLHNVSRAAMTAGRLKKMKAQQETMKVVPIYLVIKIVVSGYTAVTRRCPW